MRDLKEHIAERYGYDPEFQALMYGSTQLCNDDALLGTFGLVHPARLELFLLARGLCLNLRSHASVIDFLGNEWACGTCTFLNPMDHPQCEMWCVVVGLVATWEWWRSFVLLCC